MIILGISAFYHDSAACLIQDGEIIAAAQEERFTRKKHDQDFPSMSVDFCLHHAGVSIDQVDLVAYYEKPFLKFERILESYLHFAPRGFESFIKAMPIWIKEKLWIKNIIREELQFKGKIIFPEHHESHAASAFFPSPFQEAAFLTMDGVGEWTTTSFGVGKGNSIEILSDMKFPHSLGLLYSAFTYYTGFKVNSGEYKLMGLAPYGKPIYAEKIYNELLDLKSDGSFKLNMKYFNHAVGLTMTNEKFDNLFGAPPRKSESRLTQREMDLAASIQQVTENVVLKMAKHVQQQTGQKKLCLAGGVALNCVANGVLLREKIFDEIWIQPASGDAGGALGAALLGWHQYLGNQRAADGLHDAMQGAYLGPEYTDEYIENFLNARHIQFEKYSHSQLVEKVAGLIADEKVIGWFQGRMEFGPRALGARSIIGDARSPKMQEIMNLKIKFRESFRPFAPAVLADKASEYFEIDCESPYMLQVANVTKQHRKDAPVDSNSLFGIEKLKIIRSDIPAVTHVDFSARIQTVNKSNPVFFDVISAFERKTKCAVIVNTSFNVRGEPIVCTPEDAYRCFMRTKIDYLVLGDYLIDKSKQSEMQSDTKWKEEFILD